MKGVSELISVVLVVLIAIALVVMAYTWGLPLIQKMQSRSVTERVAGYFDPNNANSLQRKITNVASRGWNCNGRKRYNY
jgi:flagellin-like protein